MIRIWSEGRPRKVIHDIWLLVCLQDNQFKRKTLLKPHISLTAKTRKTQYFNDESYEDVNYQAWDGPVLILVVTYS